MNNKHHLETERECLSCNSDETRLELKGKQSWDFEDIKGSNFNVNKNIREKNDGEELSIFVMCDYCSIHHWLMRSKVDEYSSDCEGNIITIEDWCVERDNSNDIFVTLKGECSDCGQDMECVLSFELITQRKSKEEILKDLKDDNN